PRWTSLATFTVMENGSPSTRWKLMDFYVIPNAGTSFRSGLSNIYNGNTIKAPITGTLWKEDAPFKLRTVFFQVDDLPKAALFTLADAVIPKPGEMTPLKRKWNNEGCNIEFVALYGANAKLPPGILDQEGNTSPLPCLVYSIASRENIYLEFLAQRSEQRSRNVAEFQKPLKDQPLRYFSLVDVTPGDSVSFDFALIRDKKEFTFIANPTLTK
ncbi:MAG: hypothetical protein ABI615_11615, partial [Chthoniobacterales bacterium]